MEKLTLEHTAPYLPYGLHIEILNYRSDYTGVKYSKVNGHYFLGNELHLTYEFGNTGKSISEFKILLRPMDLTKPIIVDGKEIIPILELAKMAFPNIKYNHKKTSFRIGFEELPIQPDVWIVIDDEYGNMNKLSFNETFSCFKIDNQYENYRQLALFQWLFKHKFDVFELIEKGLAIDCNTLETNPYN